MRRTYGRLRIADGRNLAVTGYGIMKKILSVILCLLTAAVSLTGCDVNGSALTDKSSRSLTALDTVVEFTVYGDKDGSISDYLEKRLANYENKFSVTIETSEVSDINSSDGEFKSVSSETYKLISKAVQISEMTDGAFDITVYPLVKEWGFTTGEYKVPDIKTVRSLLAIVGSDKIRFNEADTSIKLLSGMSIDLGGIAKGYIAMKLTEIMKTEGLSSGLVSLGGNIHALGTKPDGSPWHVAVQHPQKSDGYLGVLSLNNEAAITSGGYQRYFEQDGEVYQHIIDPKTGSPAKTDILSATVITDDGAVGDALSTALYVMGSEKALSFLENHREFKAVIFTEDGSLLISSSLKDSFTPDESVAGYQLIYF